MPKKCQKNDGNAGKSYFFIEKMIEKHVFFQKNLEKNRSLQFFLKPFSG
jgi:hypothetical protein